MTATCSSSAAASSLNVVPLLRSALLLKPISRVWMLKSTKKFPLKKSLPLQIRSYIKNKVFEDQNEGVICYADENGEIICEGYDEGPRFHQHLPEKADHHRETEIIDLLLSQSCIHPGKAGGEELSHTHEGVAVNGFNSFC